MLEVKALFLDIDEVLISPAYKLEQGEDRYIRRDAEGDYGLDPAALERINRVVEATGCVVVVSSCARIGRTTGSIQRWLRRYGYRHRIIGFTPGGGGFRGPQIQAWLDQHHPDVYAIVDDSSDLLPEQMPRLVHVNGWVGIQDHDADRLIELLGRTP